MYEGIGRGDFDLFLRLMADDVRWHLPGRHPYAGTTRSRDALVERLVRQSEASGGSTSIEWVDAIAMDDLVVVLERLRASRLDSSIDLGAAVVFRFEGDHVAEAWDVFNDQDAYDMFWSDPGPVEGLAAAPSANKAAVLEYLHALEAKDVERLGAVLAPAFSHEMLGESQDRDGLLEEIQHSPFETMTYDVDSLVQEGDQVACRYRFSGTTHSGQAVQFSGMFIALLASGKLVSGWGEYDARRVAAALAEGSEKPN